MNVKPEAGKVGGNLIAFCGAKGVGKSTLAHLLVCNSPGLIKMAFADPLRLMLEVIGISSHYHTDNKTEPIPFLPGNPTARHLLQTLGTEWGRDCVHTDIWAVTASRRFEIIQDQGHTVVVDDMRFPNEYELVRESGGIVVRVSRPGIENQDEHVSEAHWKDFDYDFEVNNNTTPTAAMESFGKGLTRYLQTKK